MVGAVVGRAGGSMMSYNDTEHPTDAEVWKVYHPVNGTWMVDEEVSVQCDCDGRCRRLHSPSLVAGGLPVRYET